MHLRICRKLIAGVLTIGLLLAGCSSSQTDPREGFTLPDAADFSGLDRVAAFTAAHQKFSREYALTDWKGVNWDGLYRRYLPKIQLAAAANDPTAYYLALHEYVFEIDDGHISIPTSVANVTIVKGLRMQQSGGGYGLGLAELDNGTVIAAKVIDGGPAAVAGIQAGAQILNWSAQPVATAIDAVPLGSLAVAPHMATTENQRLEKARLLTRATVGTSVDIEFRNAGDASARTMQLVAAADDLANISLLSFAPGPSAQDDAAIISARTLSGYGYIRLTVLIDNLKDPSTWAQYPTATWDKLRLAMAGFAQAPGLIIDIRGNHGGSDQLAADICGFFASTPSVYQAVEFFDKRTGRFLSLSVDSRTGEVDAMMIKPQPNPYRGPVVALVNPATISSGEGIAKCINDLATGAALGFYGTHGSFAEVGGEIALPDALSIHYPYGRSVDVNGIVQIDSRNGVGGILPKVRVPRTFDNVMAFARGEDVELKYALDYLNLQTKQSMASPAK